MRRFLVILLGSCTLAACAGPAELGGAPGVRVVPGRELPEPTRTDIAARARPYLIGPFDKLSITVFGIEELSSKEVQADASGRISVPLIGMVEAAGKTPVELAEAIEAALRDRYVRNPQVTVNLVETVSQVVTVDGEVKHPGLYPVVGQMSLMRAVATAEGAGEFADLGHVVVFRTVDGQRMVALYDLGAIRRGAYEDPPIFANDVVIVGDNAARRLFRDVLQIAPSLAYPIVAIIQGRN